MKKKNIFQGVLPATMICVKYLLHICIHYLLLKNFIKINKSQVEKKTVVVTLRWLS